MILIDWCECAWKHTWMCRRAVIVPQVALSGQMWTDAEDVWRQQRAKSVWTHDLVQVWLESSLVFGGLSFCSDKWDFLDFLHSKTALLKKKHITESKINEAKVHKDNFFYTLCTQNINSYNYLIRQKFPSAN